MKSYLALLAVCLAPMISSAATLPAAPATSVKVGSQEILGDRNGMTAYIYDKDAPGVSKCYNACAKAWPPILLAANETATGAFSVTVRTDGTRQLMYQNHPVYLYVGDSQSGDIVGDGLGGIWHIIPLKP